MILKSIHNISARPGDEAGDWKPLLVICFFVWGVSFALRLFDLSSWGHPGLSLAGEHILATHDAYLWLAAAEGIRNVIQSSMPGFTSFMLGVTGMAPGELAFWMPAVLAGVVGVACALWGWVLGGRWAAIIAGLMGANLPGFFLRTRLGYYDTDLFILFFPILTALTIGLLLHGRIRGTFLKGERDADESPLLSVQNLLLWAVVLGLAARLGTYWHAQVLTISKLLLWGGGGMVLLLGVKGRRHQALQALAVFGLAAFVRARELKVLQDFIGVHFVSKNTILAFGWLGPLLAMGLAVLFWRGWRKKRSFVRQWWGTGALLLLFFVLANHWWMLLNIFQQFGVYLKPTTDVAAVGAGSGGGDVVFGASPLWPGITQSVIEAKSVDWGRVLERLGPTSWLSIVGIIGYFAVVYMRPLALLLAPFLLLGLAGGLLGIRFTMFGGPVVALGLGVPLAWVIRILPENLLKRRFVEPVLNVLIALLLLSPLAVYYSDLRITPVLDKPYAEALLSLRGKIEPNARVWSWWDYGYATQYYAKAMTVTDGGNHEGKVIFPEALALSTDSFRQSTQVMKYSAQHGYNPYKEWMSMPVTEVKALLDQMKMEEVVTEETPPQYLVVSWQALNFVGWITYYGTWDVETGEGVNHSSKRVRDFKFDPRGAVMFKNGKSVRVSTVDLLDGGPRKNKYYGSQGPHLVMNKVRKDAYFFDDVAYNSMLVQLLTGEPGAGLIGKYFELVVDDSPHVRIYRVR